MRSIHHSAQSGRPLPVDLRFDPPEEMSFSWSGIKLVVDLGIGTTPEREENGEIVVESSGAGDAVQQSRNREDGTILELGSTQEYSSLQHGIDPIKDPPDHHLDETDCNTQRLIKVEGECGSEPPVNNCSHCTWPEWGEPLPPEDLDDDLDVNFAAEVEKTHVSKKMVTFSDVVTFVEPSSLQEERETGSFSYMGSSDDELEQGTDQVTSSSDGNFSDLSLTPSPSSEKESLDSADVSAACHLLELGNESNCGCPNENAFDSSGLSRRRKGEFYDPSNDLEKLSELVERIYVALPQLSSVSGSQGIVSDQEVGYWTIEVLKDSGRFRMKRVKREKEEYNGLVGVNYLDDDDIEVLERPPWKRQYKSLRNF